MADLAPDRIGPAEKHAGHLAGSRAEVRRVALEILMEAEALRHFVDEILAREIPRFEERDRHLLQEIAYGALRHRNTLDHLLDFHLKFPTARQRVQVSWALRVGAYQLVYLDRIPPHAAVNQTLEGLKALPGAGSNEVGFVNAVLHKLAGEIRIKSEEAPVDRDDPCVLPIRRGHCMFTRPVLPLYRVDPPMHLAIKYSHPAWLIKLWLERHGDEETRELCTANNAVPVPTARVTRLAPSREAVLAALEEEGWTVAPGGLDNSFVIRKGHDLSASRTFARGWFQMQDPTAIRIGEVLCPPAGTRVLDLCSAPGGKAAQLLESVGPEGHVVAADRSEDKLALVRQNLSPIGSNFTTVIVPEHPAAIDLGQTFTHILVDAPCSNTGVLARRPEARWRIRPKDLHTLSQVQVGLLEAGLRHLAPGGRLLYSTCSIEPDENENVVAKIFARHPELTEIETRLFLPHRIPGDGGFYSLLRSPR